MRAVIFMILFSFGAAGLGLAVLADEFITTYHSRASLEQSEQSLAELERLIEDYEALTERMAEDPNLMRRVAAATLGGDPNDPNTAYPRARAQELEAARQAVEDIEQQQENSLPHWLERISEPRRRAALFLSGTFLILLSFMLFARKARSDN